MTSRPTPADRSLRRTTPLTALLGLALTLALTGTGCASALQLALNPVPETTLETHAHPTGRLQVAATTAGTWADWPAHAGTGLTVGNLARLVFVYKTDLDAAAIAGTLGLVGAGADALILSQMRESTAPAELEILVPGRAAPRKVRLVPAGGRYVADVPLDATERKAALTFRLRDLRGREIPIQRLDRLR